MNNTLYHGDCLEEMKKIPDGSVDLILTDPPYGTTACKWDTIIPFDKMWSEINRVIKPNRSIIIFSGEPFTSTLITSNLKHFKYRIDWDKKIPSGMSYARYRPMQQTEDICIFSKNGEKILYKPQMIKREKSIKSGGTNKSESAPIQNKDKSFKKTYDYKNPTTLIQFQKIRKGSIHPTQKPVDLLEYLIKTYSNENDTVLDFTMGSGSTGIACINTNRNFIGIEMDDEYFKKAKARIDNHVKPVTITNQTPKQGVLDI